jgi:hypothetical protein
MMPTIVKEPDYVTAKLDEPEKEDAEIGESAEIAWKWGEVILTLTLSSSCL